MVMDYIIDDSEIRDRPKERQYIKEIPSLRLDQSTGVGGKLYYICIPHFMDEFSNHDGNIVSLSCFPPYPRTDESFGFIRKYISDNLNNQDTKIFFDNLYEGHVISCILGIHKIVASLNINPKNVYFFTGGVEAQSQYDEYCARHQITDKINIRVLLVWERHLSYRIPDPTHEPVYTIGNKDKIFLSFNRMARKHRVALLGLMYYRGLVDKGFYSFFTKVWGDSPMTYTLDQLRGSLSPRNFNIISQNISANYSKFPLLLNTSSADENANYVKSDDEFYYANSYFSLVTETFFFEEPDADKKIYEENSVFFSEKIFKPIICKHPFIQLNRPRALEYLRKIGYKTFHPFIDESYDQIANDEMRMLAIVNEVERLSKQSNEEWIEWQKNVAHIVEHNYNVIKNKSIRDHIFPG